ncbi:MAG: hypothetical protein RBS82_13140 [Syntrophales bacterium]|jgi:hypothetical protein|nr:hypothetical protein [Syntrophales bacterium]
MSTEIHENQTAPLHITNRELRARMDCNRLNSDKVNNINVIKAKELNRVVDLELGHASNRGGAI